MKYKYYISYIAGNDNSMRCLGEVFESNISLDTEAGLAGTIKYLQEENKTDIIIFLLIKELKG